MDHSSESQLLDFKIQAKISQAEARVQSIFDRMFLFRVPFSECKTKFKYFE